MKTDIYNNLAALRAAMAAAGVDATIIPQTDPHQSEYIADHWQVLRHFSGFTGSAGTLVVTAAEARLWTDSRYFLQAGAQLAGTGITLMKDGLPDTPSITAWLRSVMKPGAVLGFDMMLFTPTAVKGYADVLAKRRVEIRDFDPAAAWTDRPALPDAKIFVHDIKYAGEAAASKVARVLAHAADAFDADAVFVSALDEIAWTLNIRSRDVEFNPVATAYLYLAPGGSTLFVDSVKLTDEVRTYLAGQGVAVAPYADVIAALRGLDPAVRVLVDPGRTSATVVDTLGASAVLGTSLIPMAKSTKNDVQLAGVRAAMERDGVALVKAFMEIERRMSVGEETTELDVAAILHDMRSAEPLYVDESFGTIAGFGPHGAIVHYEADAESASVLRTDNLLLIDSGAQYLDGTTDITRTISLGTPTAQQRRDFTLVMKGHIAIATSVFPEGTRGAQLDALARMPLWKDGLTYLHGTGHGVGHFLNVHEGPQSIRLNDTLAPLTPGMITSNEPGLYRDNVHGIRCENLVLTVPAMTTEFGNFYKFETLTLFPFDRNLFDTSIMSEDEIDWVNAYHAMVRTRLTPLLNSAERTWLELRTESLKSAERK